MKTAAALTLLTAVTAAPVVQQMNRWKRAVAQGLDFEM